MEIQWIIRNSILLFCFILVAILFLKKSQFSKINWAVFYAALWVSISLSIVNFYFVKRGFWHFEPINSSIIKMPLDLYFIWIVFWGILPIYFFKGKYILVISLFLLWIDIATMPLLEKFGVLKLSDNWLLGEILILLLVFVPSYLWGKFSYNNKKVNLRALFQVLVMVLIFTIAVPYIVISYTTNDYSFLKVRPTLFQLGFIIAFPSLIAVQDLVVKGEGTPFPYDKTKRLVQTGVYAYCRNPIQWSFTLLFIPLSIYYNSLLLLFGSIISVAYTIGISNQQEYEDMKSRFGSEWDNYKKNVPNWWFLWKPKSIPIGEIYFKRDCNQCEQIRRWFDNQNVSNLDIKYSDEYKSSSFLQVTYIDDNGMKFKSVKAISYGLEHINLAFACLGWFMRFPVICQVLQAIIDSMDFKDEKNECDY